MIDLKNLDYVKGLKSNLHVTFDSATGKEVMLFIEKMGCWHPTVMDSNETNDIVARDANRKLIGTIKTIMKLSPEQIVALANMEG